MGVFESFVGPFFFFSSTSTYTDFCSDDYLAPAHLEFQVNCNCSAILRTYPQKDGETELHENPDSSHAALSAVDAMQAKASCPVK